MTTILQKKVGGGKVKQLERIGPWRDKRNSVGKRGEGLPGREKKLSGDQEKNLGRRKRVPNVLQRKIHWEE